MAGPRRTRGRPSRSRGLHDVRARGAARRLAPPRRLRDTQRAVPDARSSLLTDAAWDASREDTCRALSLPTRPDAFIEQLAGDLDDAYQRTRNALTPQHAIHD